MNPQKASSADKRHDLLAGFASGLFILLLAEFLFGLAMEFRYSATPASAYADVHAMQTSGFAMFRAFHYWSSGILISGSFLTLVWMLFSKWFESGHRRLWDAVSLLFYYSLLSQISGNLLPFDRHGVQTSSIEAGVGGRIPVVGSLTSKLILDGAGFNDGTLSRWHFAHIGFSILGLGALWLFWTGTRGQSKNREVMWVPVGLGIIAALMVRAPLGSQATSADYGVFNAQVSWYTWPMHGSLTLFERISPGAGWLGSAVLPGLFVFFLLTVPWTVRRFHPTGIQGVFGGFCLYFLAAGIFFAGRFAPVTGSRDPAAASQPNNSNSVTSKVDPVLFAQGREFFNTNACEGCHGQDGRNPSGGPNLLGVAQRVSSDPNWYIKFVRAPASVRPTTTMPSFPELTVDQVRAIAEFLIHQQ